MDATRLLFDDHMPTTLIAGTLAYPAAMALGGFLSHRGLVLHWLGFVPVISVLAVTLAFAGRVLREGARGMVDAPSLPRPQDALRDAGPALLRFVVTMAATFGPAVLAMLLGVPAGLVFLLTCIGAFVMPAAWLNTEITGRLNGLDPRSLLLTIVSSREYPLLALATVAMLGPCTLVVLATLGASLALQVGISGPFFAAPFLIVARLMGRFYSRNADGLGFLAVDLPTDEELAAPVANDARPQVARAALQQGQKQVALSARASASPAPAARPAVQQVAAPPTFNNEPARKQNNFAERADHARRVASVLSAMKQHPDVPGLPDLPGIRVLKRRDRILAGASPSHPKFHRPAPAPETPPAPPPAPTSTRLPKSLQSSR